MTDKRVLEAWRRIDSWLLEFADGVHASLGPPANQAAADAARAAGMPSDLLTLFQIHSGQSGEVAVFEGFSLLTTAESLALRTSLRELNEQFAAEYEAIGAEYFSETWFPFLDDKAGQFACVDGRSGEVVVFIHDQSDRPRPAESLVAFLSEIAGAMERGECHVEEYGVVLTDKRITTSSDASGAIERASDDPPATRRWGTLPEDDAMLLRLVIASHDVE